ncbi:MAG: hypothetical protein ABI769_13055 [Pseudomonadota bacterium]
MKHKKKSAATTVIAISGALLAWALPALAQGPGWTANSTVIKIVDTGNGGVNVRLSPDLTGCTSQSGYGGAYASLYPSHAGIDRIKATLLTAYATGATVSLYLGDSTLHDHGSCSWRLVRILALMTRPTETTFAVG